MAATTAAAAAVELNLNFADDVASRIPKGKQLVLAVDQPSSRSRMQCSATDCEVSWHWMLTFIGVCYTLLVKHDTMPHHRLAV